MLLDTTRSIETPEGIELALRVVGPVARAIAWAIDLGIRSILYLILLFFLAKLGKLGMGLLLMSIFILEWFYPVLFEVYRQGWSASMIRNLLRAVDFLPFLYGFGFMTMLINKDFKRIGDLAAGTIVVYEDEKVKTLNLPDESPRAMPIALPLEEQQAIIKFAERAQKLPPGRAIELANIVTPMTGETGEAAIKNLYQLANSLIGVRH